MAFASSPTNVAPKFPRELFLPVGEEKESKSESKCAEKGCSSKGSSRHSSRAHSPVVHTPRKSWKQGSDDQEVKEEAPLGYEPCGSAHDMTPDSERSTPSYLVWAKDLEYVLNDGDGLKLFREYLQAEGAENALDFYYIHKSLKKGFADLYEIPDLNVEEKRKQIEHIRLLMRGIYQRWFQSSGRSYLMEHHFVTGAVREEIRAYVKCHASEVHTKSDLFDEAMDSVMEFLRVKHAAFAESDIYIEYVQKRQTGDVESQTYSDEQESSHSSSSSTCGDPARPCANYLPTVEEEESATEDTERTFNLAALKEEMENVLNIQNELIQSPQPPPVPPRKNPARTNHPSSQNGDDVNGSENGASTASSSGKKSAAGSTTSKSKKSLNQQHSFLTSKTLHASMVQRITGFSSKPGMPPNPYHTNYVPNLPPSTQDSEIHSMSSDADSFTLTDGSGHGGNMRPPPLSTKIQRHREHRIQQHQSKRNIELDVHQKVIPRTMRAPERREEVRPEGDSEDRERFARLLMEKLDTWSQKIELESRMKESLRQLSEQQSAVGTSARTKKDSKKAAAQAAEAYRMCPEQQDDMHILDDHMAHIGWDDSSKNSPHRSPGPLHFSMVPPGKKPSPASKSPDRWGKGWIPSMMTNSYPSAGMFGGSSQSGGMPPPTTIPPPQRHKTHTLSSPGQSKHHKQFPTELATDRRASLPSKNLKPSNIGKSQSDTSGISSGSSSGPSTVGTYLALGHPPPGAEEPKPPSARRPPSSSVRVFKLSGAGGEKGKMKSTDSASLPRASRGRRSEGGILNWNSGGNGFHQQHSMFSSPMSSSSATNVLSVGYYLPSEKVPYRTHFDGFALTLKQFKALLPRRFQDGAKYKYFFTCPSNEFEAGGVVHKEVVEDSEQLPLLEGKIMAKIELR